MEEENEEGIVEVQGTTQQLLMLLLLMLLLLEVVGFEAELATAIEVLFPSERGTLRKWEAEEDDAGVGADDEQTCCEGGCCS